VLAGMPLDVGIDRIDGPVVEVRQGLEPGERIVVNGLQRVRPGMQVAPQPAQMASAS